MNEKRLHCYYLGDKFPNVYFTQREVDCLFHFLENRTIAETARFLELSPRTVEFYLKNMKMKVGVKSKEALLSIIRELDTRTWFAQGRSHLLNKHCTFESLDNK